MERVNKLFSTWLSGNWRRIITPIAAIAVVSAILFFPRGQADNEFIVESGQLPNIGLVEEAEQTEVLDGQVKEITEPEKIVIDIQGAVKYPNVYTLIEGDRVVDAIEAAGGYLPEADARVLNHAMKLTDEMYIYVPKEGEIDLSDNMQMMQPSNSDSSDERKVNINTADESELTTLPGIGPSKAASIVQYRTDHGPFQTTESLMEVSGIGQKTFEKLEPFISIK